MKNATQSMKLTRILQKKKKTIKKPSKNAPSYLIWSIFTKQRELYKANTLKKKIYTSAGNRESIPSKSAPARCRQRNAANYNEIFAPQLSLACFHCSQEELGEQNRVLSVKGRKFYKKKSSLVLKCFSPNNKIIINQK